MTADLEDPPGFADRHLGALGDFFDGGLAAELLHEHLADVAQLAHGFDHVHRDADGAGMIGDGAGDGLADPPGGVSAELEAAAIFVFIERRASGRCCLPG